MALYDQKWKQQEAERIAKNRAGASETASAIGNWAVYGGVKPTERAPAFTAPDYTKPNPTNQPIMVQPVPAPKPGAMSTAAKMAPAVPKPAPIAAPPAKPKPGAFARGLFDAAAVTTDIAKAPIKGLADGANRLAIGGYNILREGVGMQPVQPRQFNYSATQDDLAAMRAENAQNPVAARPQTPAVAAPKSPTQQTPQNRVRTPAELAQASQAEVNAQTASRPGSQVGAGASPAAGAGSAPGGFVKSKDRNGNSVYTGTGAYATTDPAISGRAGTIGSVQTQNFGNPVVPQAQASIASPRVASTFGQSVRTMPDDNVIENPVSRPTDTGGMTLPYGGAFRGADAMSEAYNSREAIEMQKKVLSDLDSARFRQELIEQSGGRRGRAATEALGNIASQQAAIANGMAGQAGAAVQGRAQRDNQFGIAGMEQAGANQRQQMQADVTREGNLLDYDAKNRATEASLIEKPQYITDDQRRYLRVGADGASPVTDDSGAVIQMPQAQQQTRDYQGEAFNSLVTDLLEGQRDMAGNLPANAVQTAIQQAQQVQAARNQQQAKPSKPDLATFLARAKAQGSKMTEEQLKAAYANL